MSKELPLEHILKWSYELLKDNFKGTVQIQINKRLYDAIYWECSATQSPTYKKDLFYGEDIKYYMPSGLFIFSLNKEGEL